MARLSKTDEAATEAYNKWDNHSWYLDPTAVTFVLANSDWSMGSGELEEMAKKLFSLDRPEEYDMLRKNNSGFLPDIEEMGELKAPPSLAGYIFQESWLIFEILGQGKVECKWMLLPSGTWKLYPDYKKFQDFVKDLAVVNDSSERAVKLIQETVAQALSEKKLKKMWLVKSKIEKPKNRTKKAYREAANQLAPSDQLDIVFGLSAADKETEVSSCSELDSSMDIVDETDVVETLIAENNVS